MTSYSKPGGRLLYEMKHVRNEGTSFASDVTVTVELPCYQENFRLTCLDEVQVYNTSTDPDLVWNAMASPVTRYRKSVAPT